VKLRVAAARWFSLIACSMALVGCDKKTDDKVHITYWEKWTGVEGEAMQATVDAFNRSQDKIEVEYLAVSNADRKTLVATAGGDPPDVAGLFTYNVYSFADDAALTPLDEFIKKDGQSVETWLARYYPVYADMCSYRGTVWALPSTPAATGLHWNKALFRDAGLDPERPPQTIAELDEFAEKLTKRDPKTGQLLQLGFLPQEPGWWPWAFPVWFGGPLMEGERITAKTPGSQAAFEWIESYSRKYGLDAIKSFTSGFGNFSSPQSAFFSGKVAMVVQGVWLNNFIRQYAPGLEYGVSGWPATPNGVKDFTVADSDVLVIPRGAKHPNEAWEFIKYINSTNPKAERKEELSGMELLCYLQEKNSPLKEWSPFFEQHHPHPHIGLFRELAASSHAVSTPKMGIWEEYRREINNVFEGVRLLQRPPSDALDYCQARVEDSWNWHIANLARRASTRPAAEMKTARP
jgi:ABC-type glycerol-3-phosphate transport system substrate-binding protein